MSIWRQQVDVHLVATGRCAFGGNRPMCIWRQQADVYLAATGRCAFNSNGPMCVWQQNTTLTIHSSFLGIHLRGLSAPKRLIQLLSIIGLCMSYSSTTRCLKSLAQDSVKSVRRAASTKPVIFLYDNFNR